MPLNRISHVAAQLPQAKPWIIAKPHVKLNSSPPPRQFSRDPQVFSEKSWDFSGMSFVGKETPTSQGHKWTWISMQRNAHKHAKRNAAAEESEERGKYCQQSSRVVKFGQVQPKQSLCCYRRSSMIFQVWLTPNLRSLCTILESCWSLSHLLHLINVLINLNSIKWHFCPRQSGSEAQPRASAGAGVELQSWEDAGLCLGILWEWKSKKE